MNWYKAMCRSRLANKKASGLTGNTIESEEMQQLLQRKSQLEEQHAAIRPEWMEIVSTNIKNMQNGVEATPEFMQKYTDMGQMIDKIFNEKEYIKDRLSELELMTETNDQDNNGGQESKSPDQIIQTLISEFGTTYSLHRAGYMLPDGQLLDLGEGGLNGRVHDHREVMGLTDDPRFYNMNEGNHTIRMKELMRYCNMVRLHIDKDDLLINVNSKLNSTQVNALMRLIKEYEIFHVILDDNLNGIYRELQKPSAFELRSLLLGSSD